MTEDLVNTKYREALLQKNEELYQEFINLQKKEETTSSTKTKHQTAFDRENKKILKEKLKRMKRGINI